MKDDYGLELSLGLSFGGSSSKSKIKDTSSDPEPDEASSNKLTGSAENQDHKGKHKSAPGYQQDDNFWADFVKFSTPVTDNTDDLQNDLSQSNKRKMPFEERNFQNKHENIVSGTDVVEHEAQASNSWLVSHEEDKFRGSNVSKFNDKGPLGQNTNNLHVSVGYSLVQQPTLEAGSSRACNSQPRHAATSLSRDGESNNTENSEAAKSSSVPNQAPHIEERSAHLLKSNTSNVRDMASISSQNEDKSKEKTNQSISKGPTIRRGIGPDIKFGGSGSCPDLPWVSTTGSGPNGKTISGVSYKYSQNELRIVCACHGTHMSPEKFIQHASEVVNDT